MSWLFKSVTEDSERSSLRGVPVGDNLFCRTRDYREQIQSMVRVELELGTFGLQVQRSNRSATLLSNKNLTRLGWDSRQTLNDTREGFCTLTPSPSPFWSLVKIGARVWVVYILWFNFILGLNFTSLCYKLSIIHHNTPKQREIKTKHKIELLLY